LVRFDVPEEGSVFGTGHFGIIARNLTHDAWVVIGICAVMMPLTWWLFVAKVLYLNRLQGGNRRFRAAWRRALSEAGAAGFAGVQGLDTREAFQAFRHSALYRSYRVGLEELDTRGGIHRAGNLSEPSLDAIRAAVDAQLTQEGLKLSKGIVLLTIAIAGGPFIGLLGTVVGVMITFAAVAAAGDVNVNAIAPGIAAALAATVAGLAVAIPALFGYNYLLGRIKDVTADMRTYAEELVTRIGEGATGGTPVHHTPMMAKAAE
jgi:biopolymer transport protein ExbB